MALVTGGTVTSLYPPILAARQSRNLGGGTKASLAPPPSHFRAVVKQSQWKRLQPVVRTVQGGSLPKLPESDSRGNNPTLPYAQAPLASRMIRRRKLTGLTQTDLARRAGIGPETPMSSGRLATPCLLVSRRWTIIPLAA